MYLRIRLCGNISEGVGRWDCIYYHGLVIMAMRVYVLLTHKYVRSSTYIYGRSRAPIEAMGGCILLDGVYARSGSLTTRKVYLRPPLPLKILIISVFFIPPGILQGYLTCTPYYRLPWYDALSR